MKNSEIECVLRELSNIDSKRLPVRLSYAVAKNKAKLQAELKDILEQHTKIMVSHCMKDEQKNPVIKDNQYTFETDDIKQEAINEYNELLDLDADVELIKIPFDIIERCDESDKYDALTAGELNTLDFMIEQ